MKNIVKDLTLMLLYLTSWEEKEIGTRSWKGYNYDMLNELHEEECIAGSKRSKSVFLTEEGILKAKDLLKKYGINE